jgi:hypothetical protein
MYVAYSERGPVWRGAEKAALVLKCVAAVAIYGVALAIVAAAVIWCFQAIL